MVGATGIELIDKLLNCQRYPQHIGKVTVKVTVKSAGFGWMGIDVSASEEMVLVDYGQNCTRIAPKENPA